MATAKPLKITSGIFEQFATADTVPLGNVPTIPFRAYGIPIGGWVDVAGLAGANGSAGGSIGGSAGNSDNLAIYVPFVLDEDMSFDAIDAYIGVGNTAGTLRLGIHSEHASSLGEPGAVVVDAGTVSITSGVPKRYNQSFTAVPLTRGTRYFGVAVFQGLSAGSTNPTLAVTATGPTLLAHTTPQSSLTATIGYLRASGVSGALAANPTTTKAYSNNPPVPHLYLHRSA